MALISVLVTILQLTGPSVWIQIEALFKVYIIQYISNDKNKQNKFYTTFRWLHVIIFKWKENKFGNLIYTMRGDKT